MKMLALMKYGTLAAGTRQRLLQFNPYFAQDNIEIKLSTLFDNEYLAAIFHGKKINKRSLVASYFNRIKTLLHHHECDVIWVHSESFPYLFGFMERLVFLSGKPVIYDFDDAIFHQYDSNKNPLVRFLLGKKLQGLLRGASLTICGNKYLQGYAKQFCKNSVIIPTVVDTDLFSPASVFANTKPFTIGWIGSPSTWTYVKPIIPLLTQMAAELKLRIRVIGAGPQTAAIPYFEFIDWSEDTEVSEIQKLDVGIMPLPVAPWARGKCGYKLIQYMACGLAVVASPVGVNSEIVESGKNGFLVTSNIEWEVALRKLAADADLRKQMGQEGRRKIVEHFSLKSQGTKLSSLVRAVTTTLEY